MSAVSTSRPLEGIGVLVTRPSHQAAGLAQKISDLGGVPILFPALAIEALPAKLPDLAGTDIAIFVSPNAVEHAAASITDQGGFPSRVRVAAIGLATSAQIEASGLRKPGSAPTLLPRNGSDSEALLEQLPETEVTGRRVVIFRGQGGRQLLGDTLRARGARVEYVETYRRLRPQVDMGGLAAQWQAGRIGATLATSAEIVGNLFAMAGPAASHLRSTPMFVAHPKVAAAAFREGVHFLMVAGNGDDALVAGLATWFGLVRPTPVVQLRH